MQTLEVGTRLVLKHILFPTDFSPCAESALPYALSLARHYGSEVVVAHILPPDPWPVIPLDAIPLSMDQSYSYGERQMADFLRTDPLHGIPHKVALLKGELWEAFQQIIEQNDIDMVVLATHGRHGIRKLLLGSVAEEVFRRATCPVLTVGPMLAPHVRLHRNGDPRRILFATDFSEGSRHALPYALSLAEENRAHLTMLHVIQESPGVVLEDEDRPESPERVEAKVRVELQRLLPQEEPYLWSNCDFAMEYGMPAEAILKVAARENADLIVMGVRHAASAMAAIRFPWAIAHKVVAQAPCPVLTVRG